MDKRTFLKTSAAVGLGGFATANGLAAHAAGFVSKTNDILVDKNGEYLLPPLPYDYDALEPHIDGQTMKLHHDKHHQGYVNGLNKATKKIEEACQTNDFSLIKHWEREMAFHGSGNFLHSIFWKIMDPDTSKRKRSKQLNKYIDQSFGSYSNFESYFKASSKAVEGSGWGILAYEPHADKLVILQAEKHQNLTQWTTYPLLVIDVWEHSYYLKYQNDRKAYIDAFFNVINWDEVSKRLEHAVQSRG
jgi:superoxide dismutase, Fe-Mn family